MDKRIALPLKGRGTEINPANRFVPIHYDGAEVEPIADEDDTVSIKTHYYQDQSQSIIVTNDSPDLSITHTVNPYRGCEHGCIYCYARPFHEYFGLSCGLDFETKIMVKTDAAKLLRKELLKPSWTPVTLSFSGVTDAYQPVERKLRITRQCMEVLREFNNPVGVVTKNHLVARDKDLLGDLAKNRAAAVYLSITTLDAELARKMEPRASTPTARLAAIRELTEAGIPTGVMVAPIIPGLNEHEIPEILEAAKEAGARWAYYVMLRLPFALKELFTEWVRAHFPNREERILGRIRSVRGGKLNSAEFGDRMRGEGPWADLIKKVFHLHHKRLGFETGSIPLSTSSFSRPMEQMRLF